MIEQDLDRSQLKSLFECTGVDGWLIGPYDLSLSMNIPGQFEDPRYVNAIRKIKDVAHQTGAQLGVHAVTPDQISSIERANFAAIGLDTLCIRIGKKALDDEIKS